jgi:hypothetical protein
MKKVRWDSVPQTVKRIWMEKKPPKEEVGSWWQEFKLALKTLFRLQPAY